MLFVFFFWGGGGKSLYSYSAALHCGVQMGPGKLLGQPDNGVDNLLWTSIPFRDGWHLICKEYGVNKELN